MRDLHIYRYWKIWYSRHIKSNADCFFALEVYKRLFELERSFLDQDYQI